MQSIVRILNRILNHLKSFERFRNLLDQELSSRKSMRVLLALTNGESLCNSSFLLNFNFPVL